MADIATEPKASTGNALISLLYVARGLRGFGDGFAIIILPAYMTALGYDAVASASSRPRRCWEPRC